MGAQAFFLAQVTLPQRRLTSLRLLYQFNTFLLTMRKAAFKLGCGLVAAANAQQIGGLGRAASNPGKYAFNSTAEVTVEDVEEEHFSDYFARPKITQADPEVRAAIEELKQKFTEVLERGATHPKVQQAVKD